MENFVQGILKVDEAPYTGDMDLRLPNNEMTRLFYHDLRPRKERGEDDPLDLLLESEKWYELLVIAQIGLVAHNKVTYSPDIPAGTKLKLVYREIQLSDSIVKDTKVVQGIILDLHWDASSVSYLVVGGPRVYTHPFVLVETAIGKMVLSYNALEERLGEQVNALKPGGYLEWEPCRLDLLAIIAKHAPEPAYEPVLSRDENGSDETQETFRGFDATDG